MTDLNLNWAIPLIQYCNSLSIQQQLTYSDPVPQKIH